MSYRPYRCGSDCRGGYNCLICLFVFNLKKVTKKLKKLRLRKGDLKKTSSTMNIRIKKKD